MSERPVSDITVAGIADTAGAETTPLVPAGPAFAQRLAPPRGTPPLRISHVAAPTKRYPGEPVTLYTRVEVARPVAGFTVRIHLPPGLVVQDYRALRSDLLPYFETAGGAASGGANGADGGDATTLARRNGSQPAQFVIWQVDQRQTPGALHEFAMDALVDTGYQDQVLRSQAWVLDGVGAHATVVDREALAIAVHGKGRYLLHLPALFEQDDFMGRFLMMFESFWQPIDQQIDQVSHYFDPQITPPRFLPWLASWFNLTLDDLWTEAQQRRLLGAIARLYRMRGTKEALQEYLEIYTGGTVEIVERRARNLRLGPGARLGVGVAMGTGNVPHSCTVRIDLSPIPYVDAQGRPRTSAEVAVLEQQRLHTIRTIIDHEKPAHVSYTLEIRERSGDGPLPVLSTQG